MQRTTTKMCTNSEQVRKNHSCSEQVRQEKSLQCKSFLLTKTSLKMGFRKTRKTGGWELERRSRTSFAQVRNFRTNSKRELKSQCWRQVPRNCRS